MRQTLMAAALVLPLAATLPANASSPAPQSPAPGRVLDANALLQPAYHPASRCGAWRRECAARWGWGTWRFHRCMGWRGC